MAISKEFKIGIFVVAVIIAAFIVINILRGADILGREITLKGHFDNVENLVASAPVKIRGYAAGRVNKVDYIPETDNFEVEISVDKRFRIPSDSRMMIYSTSIMGGKGIEIQYGTSTSMAENSDELSTGSAPDLISSLSEAVTPLINKINGITDSLQCTVSSVNDLLDAENRKAIASSLESLDAALQSVKSFAGSLDSKSDDIATLVSNLEKLSAELSPAIGSLNNTLKNASDISEGLKNTDIDGTVASLKETLQSINGAVESIKEPVTNFVANTDSLINAIKKDPKKYIKVSVF